MPSRVGSVHYMPKHAAAQKPGNMTGACLKSPQAHFKAISQRGTLQYMLICMLVPWHLQQHARVARRDGQCGHGAPACGQLPLCAQRTQRRQRRLRRRQRGAIRRCREWEVGHLLKGLGLRVRHALRVQRRQRGVLRQKRRRERRMFNGLELWGLWDAAERHKTATTAG